jgi:hypothetical protein
MRRREFITLVGGTATWPLVARAQQRERMRRIGVLMAYAESAEEGQAVVEAFRQELQKLGWTDGRNLRIDYRWAAVNAEAMERFAKELVAAPMTAIRSPSRRRGPTSTSAICIPKWWVRSSLRRQRAAVPSSVAGVML